MWGENATRETNQNIILLPGSLLLTYFLLEGRTGRLGVNNNRLRVRKPCALGFHMIVHGNAALWKSN